MKPRHPKPLGLAIFLAAALGACGGGGGSPGATGAGAPTLPVNKGMLTLVMTDRNANPISTLSGDAVGTLKATVLDSNGKGASTSVRFTTSSALLALTPSSGVAATNSLGEATVSAVPASASAQGLVTVTASATVNGQQLEDTFEIAVNGAR